MLVPPAPAEDLNPWRSATFKSARRAHADGPLRSFRIISLRAERLFHTLFFGEPNPTLLSTNNRDPRSALKTREIKFGGVGFGGRNPDFKLADAGKFC